MGIEGHVREAANGLGRRAKPTEQEQQQMREAAAQKAQREAKTHEAERERHVSHHYD